MSIKTSMLISYERFKFFCKLPKIQFTSCFIYNFQKKNNFSGYCLFALFVYCCMNLFISIEVTTVCGPVWAKYGVSPFYREQTPSLCTVFIRTSIIPFYSGWITVENIERWWQSRSKKMFFSVGWSLKFALTISERLVMHFMKML